MHIDTSDGMMDGQLAVIERDIVTDELARAKTGFHEHAGVRPHVIEWRSIPTQGSVAQVVAEQARCADLVITGAGRLYGAVATHADTGDLILRAGRPVLVVPDEHVADDFRTVMLAWSDTRECRRAVSDALPILRDADRVVIVAVGADSGNATSGTSDVAAWLARHGIDSDRIVARSAKSTGDTLASLAIEMEADLAVAGAFGHSRIREWAFGGVTRQLLQQQRHCTLLSH